MKNGKPSSSSTAKSERRPKRVEPRSSSWMKPTFGPSRPRGKWVLKGEAALVDCPRWGEKALLLVGRLGRWKPLLSTAFLQQLRANHPGPLVVIWDNGPAHRGAAIRSYLTTPDLHRGPYRPTVQTSTPTKPWDWAREEVTANECHGTKAKVQEKMNPSAGHRKESETSLPNPVTGPSYLYTCRAFAITAQCPTLLWFRKFPARWYPRPAS